MTLPQPRVALVTGANTGIGRAAAIELARRGLSVVLASRDPERNAAAAEAVRSGAGHDRLHTIGLDLGSLASVRQAADDFLALGLPLHVLVANAGVAGQAGRTEDGFERTFGVNHLGHFLLTQLLLHHLVASAPARIVVVSSQAHYRARSIDFDALMEPTRLPGLRAYQRSKLANVLFTVELARRLEGTGVDAYAVHPGVIASAIWRGIPAPIRFLVTRFMGSVEDGAAPIVHLATADDVGGDSGDYFEKGSPRRPNPLALDEGLADDLWRRSAEWTGADALPHTNEP